MAEEISKTTAATVEETVRDIRRKARKKYSAEEKVRIVLEGLREKKRYPRFAAAKVSIKTCITNGAKNFWKRASSA